jgi:cell division protein FtsB
VQDSGSRLANVASMRKRSARFSRRRRPSRASLVRRWLAVGALCAVAVLYVQPLRTYLETRATLTDRTTEVRRLEERKRALERRLAAQTSNASLVREARRLAYVKPGEQLFIVKGVDAWRRAQASAKARIGR